MAARFWVGGTGTWDASDTTHWSGTSGGAGGSSVPGTADDVTIDNHASGLNGGTITVNTNPTILSLTMNTMTGTLDFATNNNSITATASGGIACSGTSTRVLNMGSGTWTLSNNAALWQFTTVTGLTLNQGSSTIAFTGTGGTTSRRFVGGAKTYNIVSVASGSAAFVPSGGPITTLTISPGNRIHIVAGTTFTVTTLTNISGSSSAQTLFNSDNPTNGAATISSANNWTGDWCGFANMTFSGGGTFSSTNSFNFNSNTGITITPPSVGGGGVVGVIGG